MIAIHWWSRLVMVAQDSDTDFSEYLETWYVSFQGTRENESEEPLILRTPLYRLVIKVLSYALLFFFTIAHFLYSRKAEKPSWAGAKLSSKYPYPGYPKPGGQTRTWPRVLGAAN